MNRGFTIATVVVILMAAISAVTLYNAPGSSVDQYLAGGLKLVYTVEEGRTETFYAQQVDGELKATWNHGSANGDHSEVEEHHGGKMYTYSTPNTDFLIGLVNGNADLDAAQKEELIAGYESLRGEKAECTVAGDAAATADVTDAGLTIINGGSQIVYGDNTFDIVSIGAMSADELASAFNGCSDARALSEHMSDLASRNLGWQETLSQTEWCGAGTDNCNTICPGQGGRGSWGDNIACRRHDHGSKYESALGFAARLECRVDQHLLEGASAHAGFITNSAVHVAFGSWGAAQVWGCFNWKQVKRCGGWSCGWRGCSRSCSYPYEWTVNYGPFRYNGISDRGSAMYKGLCKNCPNDPRNWGGWNR